MSTKGGIIRGHRFHGAPERFEVLAEYIYNKFGRSVKYIADVAGGQGMLTRILNKKYNYQSEIFDTRDWTLVGVPHRHEEFKPSHAEYYDLVIGLHPDAATRSIAQAALIKPTILIPCCNFWDQTKKLGREALLTEISKFYDEHGVKYEKIILKFEGPKNIALVSKPVQREAKTNHV
jgi:hypothetical protein